MANFHRIPFVILTVVVLVIAGCLTYFYTIYREPLPPEYGWGAARTLLLDLTIEDGVMSINGRLNFTARLTNTGGESIRIYPCDWLPDVFVMHDSRTVVGYFPPVEPARRPSDAEFNRMLVVLEPNGTYSRQGYIWNETARGHGWDLHPGMDYSLICRYAFTEKRDPPALPVWTGTAWSNTEYFSVLP